MGNAASAIVPVDSSLRFTLFGLECAMEVEFLVTETERVFIDPCKDQVSAKEYVFFDAAGVRVSGHVAEYEPDMIELRIEGGAMGQAVLDSIVERARYQALRYRREWGIEPSAARVLSPRLANPEQASYFAMEVRPEDDSGSEA
jgi:hypothetical protein